MAARCGDQHRVGGVSIAGAAEALPKTVKTPVFVAACLPVPARTARDFFHAEPLKPAATPLQVSAARCGSVRKVCVKTVHGRAFSPRLRQQMIERAAVRQVVEINSGHSPSLSQPQALTDALLAAARQ